MDLTYMRVCRVRCCRCGSILEYQNQSKNDCGPSQGMVCGCGSIGLAPAALMHRILVFDKGVEYEDLSEVWR